MKRNELGFITEDIDDRFSSHYKVANENIALLTKYISELQKEIESIKKDIERLKYGQ